MKERGIIFTSHSVRSILAGTKTQTRRIVKPQPTSMQGGHCVPACSYAVGQRLWVRENWGVEHEYADNLSDRSILDDARRQVPSACVVYASSEKHVTNPSRWRSPLFMPRWASRITLEVTKVRVQRLQEISGEDARAEGIAEPRCDCETCSRSVGMCTGDAGVYVEAYARLWDSINKARASWDSNPWVFAISFRRVEQEARAAQ